MTPAPSAAAGPAAEMPGLYDSHEMLQLTISAPLMTLLEGAGEDNGVSATVAFEDGRSVAIKLKTYGKSRRRECDLPPLKLDIELDSALGTPFEGAGPLRIVTHCRSPELEGHVLLEYLLYRAYTHLAEPALRVRLANFRYQETDGSSRDIEALGYFIEDIGVAAERSGSSWLDIQRLRLADLDATHTALVGLFQYMAGNTDWSALSGPPGERCCHNAAVVSNGQPGPHVLLPYDFDQSGLINTPYAVPAKTLGLRDVTQRKYRGFCAHNNELIAAITTFNTQHAELESLFADPSLPHAAMRANAWKYITRFYREINDPKKLSNRIVGRCRKPTG